MHIYAINSLYPINSNIQTISANKNKNCSFKAEPWIDDDYDSDSIFGLMDKRDRQNNVEEISSVYTAFSAFACPPEDNFANLKINSLRYIGNSCHKGGMVDAVNYVKKLKENGIKKMIVLCTPIQCDISDACKKNNMDYSYLHVPLCVTDSRSEKDFNKDFSTVDFIGVVKDLRKGNIFIGCESGNIRTKRFLQVVKILDPECKLQLRADPDKYDYIVANWIHKGMDAMQKIALNYTEQFETKLKQTLAYHTRVW